MATLQTTAVTGSLTVTGQLIAQSLNVQQVTSSIVYSSGSNIFGKLVTDVQQLTGSLRVTGSGEHWIMGGSLGIGTTAPSEKLHVVGKILQNNGGSLYLDANATNTVIASTGARDLLFEVNSGNRLAILSGGNVGIGTTVPSSLLHVSKAGNSAGGTILMGVSNTIDKWSYLVSTQYNSGTHPQGFSLIGGFSSATVNTITIGGAIYEANPATEIQFWTHTAVSHSLGGSQRMTINSNGNVGIGSTSPSTKLDVIGDTFVKGVIFAYAGSGGNQVGGITWDSTDDGILFLKSSNVTKVSINSNGVSYFNGGNVGIGTTAPSSRLSIQNNGASDNIIMNFLMTNGSNAATFRTTDSGAIFGIHSQNSGDIYIKDTSDTVLFYGKHGGNVGIGTTAPANKLDIAGSLTVGTGLAGTNTDIAIKNATNAKNHYVFSDSSTGELGIESGASVGIKFNTSGANTRMVITSGGDVGIGTTNPDQYGFAGKLLTLNASSSYANLILAGDANSGIAFGTSTGRLGQITMDSSTGFQLFSQSTGTGLTMVLNRSGNVGIGTTSPGTRTEIYRVESSNRTTYTDLLTITANATTNPYAGHGGGILFKGTTYRSGTGTYDWGRIGMELTDNSVLTTGENMFFEVAAADNSSTLTRAMTIQFNGNVGIGTTSPSEKLQVDGSNVMIKLNAATDTFAQLGYYENGTLKWNAYNNYANDNYQIGNSGGAYFVITSGGSVGIGTTSPARTLDINGEIRTRTGTIDFSNDTNNQIYVLSSTMTLKTNGSDRMTITSGGNVGINTTSPDQLLRLNGNAGQPGTTGTTQNGIIRMVGWTTGSNSGYGETLDMGFHVGLSGPPSYAWLQATNWSGLNINYNLNLNPNGGNVGIGTTTPAYRLQVSGNAYINETLYVNGATTVDDNFYVTNGNVGIGTTNPSFLLNIYGSNAATVYQTSGTGTGAGNGFYVGHTGNISYVWNYNNFPLVLATNNAEVMRITGSNVGIGTTLATARLHVSGTAGGIFEVDGAAAVTALYVSASGNVGIGITTPAFSLDVSGVIRSTTSTNISSLILRNTTAGSYSQMMFDGDNADAYLFKGNSTYSSYGGANSFNIYNEGPLAFHSSTTSNIMFMTAAGNVGIGTTSPGYSLQVGNTGAGYNMAIIGSTTAGIEIRTSTAGGRIAALEQYFANEGSLWLYDSNTVKILFRASGSSYINPTVGNVGIGTTSPAAKLEVNDGTGYFYIRGNAAGDFQGAALAPHIATGDFTIYAGAIGSGTARVTVKNGGSVGIGTTSPTSILHLVSAGSSIMKFFRATTTYGFEIASTTFGLYDYTNTIYRWRVNNTDLLLNETSGNVGIGTTSPGQALHVVGNVYVQDDSTTGNGIMLRPADRPLITRGWDAFASGNKAGLGRWGVYMEAAELFLASPGTDYTNGLVTIGGWVTDGTRQPNLTVNNYTRQVGIGTTSPGTKAEIYRIETSNRTTYTDILTINAAANTNPYSGHGGGILFKGTTYRGDYNWGRIGMELTDNSVLTTGENMFFEVAAADNSSTLTRAMTIQFNGNIGINTTSPSGRLHVYNGAATDTYLESGTSGTTGKLIFKTSDNADLNKYIMQEAYYMLFNGHANEGFKFRDSAGTTLMTIYGTNNTYAGRVGIGTTAPAFPLDVNGPGRFVSNASSRVLYLVQNSVNAGNIIQFRDQSSTDIGEIVYRNNQFYIYSNAIGGYIMYANPANGNVGIKTSSISYALDVSGDIRATGDIIAYSDARVKDNIQTVEGALDKIKSLRGVTYTRKDTDDKSEKVGVIAQEVLPILPQVVQKDTNGNYSVAYGNIVGVLIEAIKELKAEIDILKNK